MDSPSAFQVHSDLRTDTLEWGVNMCASVRVGTCIYDTCACVCTYTWKLELSLKHYSSGPVHLVSEPLLWDYIDYIDNYGIRCNLTLGYCYFYVSRFVVTLAQRWHSNASGHRDEGRGKGAALCLSPQGTHTSVLVHYEPSCSLQLSTPQSTCGSPWWLLNISYTLEVKHALCPGAPGSEKWINTVTIG